MTTDEYADMATDKQKLVAKFSIGDAVKHRVFPFRGVVFDVDPTYNNSTEWWESIPEQIRPRKDQPFYHLFAENDEDSYIAYVSEQNLLPDDNKEPVNHPQIWDVFEVFDGAHYRTRSRNMH